jgi:hypothetical protein
MTAVVSASVLLAVSLSACANRSASLGDTSAPATPVKIEPAGEGVHPSPQDSLEERLRAHLAYLTSETCEGRLVGTPGAGRAAGYVLEEFKSIGLRPAFGESYVQEFTPVQVAKVDVRLEILDSKKNVVKAFAFYHDFTLASYTKMGETLITSKLVNLSSEAGGVGSGSSGGVAIARTNRNRFSEMGNKAEQAGCSALILCDADRPPGLPLCRFYDSIPRPQGWTFPILWVEPECFDELAQAASAGRLARIRIMSKKWPEAVGFNVAGATGDPTTRKVVVVCAHRDSIGRLADGSVFQGAVDNGSGTTILIELARALSKVSSDKAFVFLSTDSEESRMEGATFFAKHLPFRAENLAAVVNLDCIGTLGKGPMLVDSGSTDEGKRIADVILRRLTEAGIRDLKVEPFVSDHTVFQDQGYTVIGIIAPRDGFVRYHTLADTIDTVDIGELATVVEALTRALTEP